MKFICNYRELDGDISSPSMKDNISIVAIDNKDKVLRYLKSGKLRFATTAPIIDVFTNERINVELVTYTDGNYAWTSEEIYYFEKYNIKLSDEFIKSIN